MALWEKADPAGTDSKCDHIMNGIRYIWKGLQSLRHRRLDVAVLDATGIAVSLLRQDMGTAGSVMFLLGIGELLEEWTHKKSVGDLARSMSLNVEKYGRKLEIRKFWYLRQPLKKAMRSLFMPETLSPSMVW